MVNSLKARVLENKKILPDFYEMVLSAPAIAAEAVPGQFLMVKTSPTLVPFLRRPISLSRIKAKEGTITLIYQVVGSGTKLLSEISTSSEIDVVGPLGNGFTWSDEDKVVAVVGGGCGIAPLVALTEELLKAGKEVFAFLGAQSKDKLLSDEYFAELGAKVMVATDDGSLGRKGFVTQILEEVMNTTRFDRVYCCGPLPMTKAVVKLTKEALIPCQVSLEERMGCGVGACLGCVCKIRSEEGSLTYKKVCHDGPVFTSSEVIFDD